MPLSSLTCPICLSTLTPKTAVAEGTRIRCPKCKGSFTAEAEPKPPEPEPTPTPEPIPAETQEPMPEPAALDEPVATAEPIAPAELVVPEEMALDEIADLPPRPRPRRQDDDYDRPRRRSRRDDYAEDEAEGPSRFRKRPRKGVEPWVWLVGGGIGLLILLGCCGIGGIFFLNMLSGWSINIDNYNKIQAGMTPTQVEAIMGRPTGSGGPTTGFGSEQWRNGDYSITVTFVNGRAFGKACHLQAGLGTVDRQDILGP